MREELEEETPEEELRRWNQNRPILLCDEALQDVDISVDFDGEVGIVRLHLALAHTNRRRAYHSKPPKLSLLNSSGLRSDRPFGECYE